MGNSHRHSSLLNTVSTRAEYFKNSFIPNVVNEWNNLNPEIDSLALYNLFGNTLLKFIRFAQGKTVYINNLVTIKFLTRLRFCFNHLREYICVTISFMLTDRLQ